MLFLVAPDDGLIMHVEDSFFGDVLQPIARARPRFRPLTNANSGDNVTVAACDGCHNLFLSYGTN